MTIGRQIGQSIAYDRNQVKICSVLYSKSFEYNGRIHVHLTVHSISLFSNLIVSCHQLYWYTNFFRILHSQEHFACMFIGNQLNYIAIQTITDAVGNLIVSKNTTCTNTSVSSIFRSSSIITIPSFLLLCYPLTSIFFFCFFYSPTLCTCSTSRVFVNSITCFLLLVLTAMHNSPSLPTHLAACQCHLHSTAAGAQIIFFNF